MTLIATAISNVGLVMASDSNLTSETDEYAGEAQKVFRFGTLSAALAIAGTYSIGGKPMNEWMPAAIESYESYATRSLRGFARYLADQLSAEIWPDEAASGTLIHIVGYVDVDGEAHPEFWFVRNIAGIDQMTGEYIGSDHFDVSEDFWYRDYLNPRIQDALESGTEMRYFNGFPAGRIAYLEFIQRLGDFLRVWRNDARWRFRQPQTVDELARFVDLEVRAIGAMFESSDYAAPYIGGPVQIEMISRPVSVVRLHAGAPTSRRGPAD